MLVKSLKVAYVTAVDDLSLRVLEESGKDHALS